MTTETFTIAGAQAWSCPSGVTSVLAKCWGDAGGGASNLGGGGGGGGYAEKTVTVSPGNGYDFYIGAGGGIGANGQGTYFIDTSTVYGYPGEKATGATAGRGGGTSGWGLNVGDVTRQGGAGANSSGAGGGGGGGGAGSSAAGSNAIGGAGGAGGATDGGNGGAGGIIGAGTAGSIYGGGGGGGNTGANGAAGAQGKMELVYTIDESYKSVANLVSANQPYFDRRFVPVPY